MTQELNTAPADDFEKAFAELAGKPTEGTTEAPKPQGEQPQADDAAAAATPDSQAQAEPSQASAQPAGDADVIADLRRQLQESQQRERSSAGRVSHFMRESNQHADRLRALEQELQELRAAKAAPAGQPSSDDADLSDALAEAPELRAAVERRVGKAVAAVQAKLDAAITQLAHVGKKVDSAAQAVEPLVSREEERQAQSVYEALDQRFAGWREDVKAPAFQSWLQGQPRQVQELYLHGQAVEDAATVLTLFRASTGAPKSEATAPQGAQPAQAGAAGDKQQRLREAAGIAPVSRAPVVNRKDDFEGAFAEFAAGGKR